MEDDEVIKSFAHFEVSSVPVFVCAIEVEPINLYARFKPSLSSLRRQQRYRQHSSWLPA